MLTKGAIGNLINRYKAVLKKCNLINTFGSLAVASMLVMGGAGEAKAWPFEYHEGIDEVALLEHRFIAVDKVADCAFSKHTPFSLFTSMENYPPEIVRQTHSETGRPAHNRKPVGNKEKEYMITRCCSFF